MISTYEYHTDYIPTEFWDVLDTGVQRIRLLKDITGCGATYGIMKKYMPDTKRFIVMPTIKLIQDKQKQADTGEFNATVISLHGDSKYAIKDIFDADIILLTPDQLVKLYEYSVEVWFLVKGNILIIDEEHTIEGAGGYRDSFGQLEYAAQHWNGSIITITATTPFCTTPYFDGFDVIQLTNKSRPINQVQVTKIDSVVKRYLEDYISSGEPTVVISNDIKKYKHIITKVCKKYGASYKNINGVTLDNRMRLEGLYSDSNDAQVYLLSTAATEGIDLNIEAHVVVLCDYNLSQYTFSLQTIIQALGRPREGLLDSIVYFNDDKTFNGLFPIPLVQDALDDVDTFITNTATSVSPSSIDALLKAPHVMSYADKFIPNVGSVLSEISSNINYNIIHSPDYLTQMNSYAKSCNIEFINPLRIKIRLGGLDDKSNFTDKLESAFNLTPMELSNLFHDLTLNIRGGAYGSFSKTLLLAVLLAQVKHTAMGSCKELLPFINDLKQPSQVSRFLNSVAIMSAYVSENIGGHFTSLYLGDKHENGHLHRSISTTYEISFDQPTINDLRTSRISQKPTTTTLYASSKGLSDQAVIQKITKYTCITKPLLSQKQIDVAQIIFYMGAYAKTHTHKTLNDKIADSAKKKHWDKKEIAKQKKTWKNELNKLAGLSMNGYTKDRQRKLSTRTYSAVTALPMTLINQIHPHDVLEVDISSANPTFIDMLIGSKLRKIVYKNVVKSESCTRDEAKVKYNQMLNSTNNQWEWSNNVNRTNTMINWGYTKQQANLINKLSGTGAKSEMFYVMTEQEKILIEEILTAIPPSNNIQTIRRHDSILYIAPKQHREELETIMRQVDTIKFKEFALHHSTSWQKDNDILKKNKLSHRSISTTYEHNPSTKREQAQAIFKLKREQALLSPIQKELPPMDQAMIFLKWGRDHPEELAKYQAELGNHPQSADWLAEVLENE